MPDNSRARALNYFTAVALVNLTGDEARRLLRGAQAEAIFASGHLVQAMTQAEYDNQGGMVDYLVKAREELKAALAILKGLVGDE